jgi:ribosomal protein S1
MIKAKVIKIDPVERKIGLSIREYKREVDRSEMDQYMNTQKKADQSLGAVAQQSSKRSKK